MHETLEPEEQQRSRNWGGARAGAGRPVTKPVHDLRVAMMAGAIRRPSLRPSLLIGSAKRVRYRRMSVIFGVCSVKAFFEVLSEEYPAPVAPTIVVSRCWQAPKQSAPRRVRIKRSVAVFSVSAAAPSSLSGLRKAGYLKAGGRTLSHSQGRLILCTKRAPRHAGLA